jgi:hypothetical protein
VLKRVFSAIREGLTSKQVTDRAGVVEDVLLGKMSGNDSEAIQAVAQLTTALCNNKCEGVVDAGFFIFFKVKTKDDNFQIFHKRLTVKERSVINDKPSILLEPTRILERFDDAVALDAAKALELRAIALSSSGS